MKSEYFFGSEMLHAGATGAAEFASENPVAPFSLVKHLKGCAFNENSRNKTINERPKFSDVEPASARAILFFRRAAREIRQVETKNIFIFPETLNVERRILMKNSEWPPPEMRQNDSEFGGGWGHF